jgi:formimidoylglutamate deiminase
LGIPSDKLLDALVFSSPDARFSEVFVAGGQVVKNGQTTRALAVSDDRQQIKQDFVRAMQQLWV